jgi:uncharacterized protein (DUF58 family)
MASQDLFDSDFLRKLEYLDLIARRLVFGRRQALRDSRKRGVSIEFKDFREYSQGDDPRSVDWSVYARLGELVIKLFREEEELDLWILLDSSASMDFGEPNKFDQARRIAAALAYIGLSNMDSASIAPFTDDLVLGRQRLRGRGSVFAMLEFLTNMEPGGTTDFETTVRSFASVVRKPSLVVVLSDFYGLRNACSALDRLRYRRHQVHVVQMMSPWERNPSIRGELRLVDTESGEHEDLVITDSMLKRYVRAFEALGSELRGYSMGHAIGYAAAPTEVPFDEFVRKQLLHPGGLLK